MGSAAGHWLLRDMNRSGSPVSASTVTVSCALASYMYVWKYAHLRPRHATCEHAARAVGRRRAGTVQRDAAARGCALVGARSRAGARAPKLGHDASHRLAVAHEDMRLDRGGREREMRQSERGRVRERESGESGGA